MSITEDEAGSLPLSPNSAKASEAVAAAGEESQKEPAWKHDDEAAVLQLLLQDAAADSAGDNYYDQLCRQWSHQLADITDVSAYLLRASHINGALRRRMCKAG